MDGIRVDMTRGSIVETRHRVVAARADVDGALETFGEAAGVFPVRSVVKPVLALTLLRSSAVPTLTDERIAIASASHNGEPSHIATVLGWLADLGLAESHLQCPPAVPLVEELAEDYLRAGLPRRRAVHNCSGKHAGFLAQAVATGADLRSYLSKGSPVQRAALDVIEDASGAHVDPSATARDGCGAPVVCLTLHAVARSVVSLAPGGRNSTDGARILSAISAHPLLLAGAYRFDSRMAAVTDGRCLSKSGADGIHVAVVPALGVAVAVKAIDGARRAAEAAIVHLLSDLGALSSPEVPHVLDAMIRDDAGIAVGEIRATFDPE